MWDVLKYIVVIALIAYAVTWFFGEGMEQRRKQEYNAAIQKFYEAENRYPASLEEMERKGYIDRFTNRDRAPVNGTWMVDEDKGKIYIFRYRVGDRGKPIKDEDGNVIGKREY
jgi:hypothetical protein